MDYEQFGKDIIRLVGGKENISGLEHCVTRLRFTLNDKAKADTNELKKMKGVLGIVDAKQYQVVLGGEVIPTFEAIETVYKFTDPAGNSKHDSEKTTNKKGKITAKDLWESLLDYLSGTMVQIIPLFIGCGLISCILSVCRIFFEIDTNASTYLALYSIANMPFYFLPGLVGFAAARKLKCNPFLGAAICLFLLHPSFMGMVGSENPTTLFGIPFAAVSYSSTVFPALIGVWILSKVEPAVYRILPKIVKTVFGPFMCLLVMCPLMLIVVGPAGYYFGQFLAKGILSLQNLPFGLGCAVISGLQPVLVMLGAHTVLAPSIIENINTIGYDALIRPGFIMASFGGLGSTLAVTLRCKNKEFKSIAAGAAFTQFLGTSEPALYAVMLPLVRPFIATVVGSFAGGMCSSILGAKAYSMGKNGVFGWLVYEDTIPQIMIASVVAMVVGFLLSWILGFDERKVTGEK